MLVKWLARVRGPELAGRAACASFRALIASQSTKVVVTEYELPRQLLALHDAAVDGQGNIWYTSHKTRYVGKIDPKTGISTEYTMPLTPGRDAGARTTSSVDKNGIAWIFGELGASAQSAGSGDPEM